MTVRLLTNIGRLWTGSEVVEQRGDFDRMTTALPGSGPPSELPGGLPGVIEDIVDVDQVENLGGALVTPGLIDAHTHPVYAGNRWAELAMRSGGASATEIAAAGGGMSSTVTVTRGTDPWTLCNAVRGAPAGLAAERHHHDRGQDRLPPDQGRRAGRRPAAALAGERAGHAAGARHVPGRARRAARVLRPPPRLRRRGRRLVRGRRRGRRRQRRRVLRRRAVHRARGALDAQRRARCRAAAPAARLRRLAHRRGAGSPPRSAARRPTCCTRPTTSDVAALAKANVAAVVCPATSPGDRPDPAGPRAARPGVAVALGSGHSPGSERDHLDAAGDHAGDRATSG